MTDRERKIRAVAHRRQKGLIMVLEDVHDPHNAAAILRSCDAFGVQAVWFIFDKQKRYNPARVGKVSSSSANKWLSYRFFSSTKECIRELHAQKYTVLASVLDQRAKSAFSFPFKKHPRIAIMVGNEKEGLSKEAIRGSDARVYIPMRGMVQSFNVSVSAALFLYAISFARKGFFSRIRSRYSAKEIGKLSSDLLSR